MNGTAGPRVSRRWRVGLIVVTLALLGGATTMARGPIQLAWINCFPGTALAGTSWKPVNAFWEKPHDFGGPLSVHWPGWRFEGEDWVMSDGVSGMLVGEYRGGWRSVSVEDHQNGGWFRVNLRFPDRETLIATFPSKKEVRFQKW